MQNPLLSILNMMISLNKKIKIMENICPALAKRYALRLCKQQNEKLNDCMKWRYL
jgi:hypothetical protein